MLTGRTDDPRNPRRVAAFEVSVPFGVDRGTHLGQPLRAAQTGRTRDRNRTASVICSAHPLRPRGRPHTPYVLYIP
jgi:hypothetical protein